MLALIVHPFTLTNWTGDWEIVHTFGFDKSIFFKNFVWMTSWNDYLEYYNNGEKRWKIRIKTKLETLALNLEKFYKRKIDPIEYLIYLYYQEELSVEDIYIRTKDIWMTYSESDWLFMLFRKTFWWILRDNSWSIVTTKKKQWGRQIIVARGINDEKNREKYILLQEYISSKVNNILSNTFDSEFYNWLRNKTEKILYLVWLSIWINQDDIVLLSEKHGIWARVMANFLNTEISIFLANHNINLSKITPMDITRIVKKAYES